MTENENKLMALLIEVANKRYDGHLTVLKFTTNWRVGFVTPDARDDVAGLAVGKTFTDAAQAALAKAAVFDDA